MSRSDSVASLEICSSRCRWPNRTTPNRFQEPPSGPWAQTGNRESDRSQDGARGQTGPEAKRTYTTSKKLQCVPRFVSAPTPAKVRCWAGRRRCGGGHGVSHFHLFGACCLIVLCPQPRKPSVNLSPPPAGRNTLPSPRPVHRRIQVLRDVVTSPLPQSRGNLETAQCQFIKGKPHRAVFLPVDHPSRPVLIPHMGTRNKPVVQGRNTLRPGANNMAFPRPGEVVKGFPLGRLAEDPGTHPARLGGLEGGGEEGRRLRRHG